MKTDPGRWSNYLQYRNYQDHSTSQHPDASPPGSQRFPDSPPEDLSIQPYGNSHRSLAAALPSPTGQTDHQGYPALPHPG